MGVSGATGVTGVVGAGGGVGRVGSGDHPPPPPQPDGLSTIVTTLLVRVELTHSSARAVITVDILVPTGPVVRESKTKVSLAHGGRRGIVKVIVPEISSTTTEEILTRVPLWKKRLPLVYVDPVPHGIVTVTFVPVAVPLLERVSVWWSVSFRRRLPPLTSVSTAVVTRRGALIVTGTLDVPHTAHSLLFPTCATVEIVVPGATFVSAVTR